MSCITPDQINKMALEQQNVIENLDKNEANIEDQPIIYIIPKNHK